MIIDRIDCTIQRRLLVNYRIDPQLVAGQLPAPFRPQIVSGGPSGVCASSDWPASDLMERPDRSG